MSQTSMRVECGACGLDMGQDQTERPCPRCGDIRRHIQVNIIETLHFNDSMSAEMATVATGRRAVVARSAGPAPPYSAVRDFLLRLGPVGTPFDSMLFDHPVATKIRIEMANLRVRGIMGTYYRVRSVDHAGPPASMGANPHPTARGSEGRYSPADKRALYLARTRDAALAETPIDSRKPHRWIQRFELRLHTESALRLRTDLEGVAPTLHHALLQSEHERVMAHEIDPYRVGHFLREVAEREDIVALEYPAIRGGYGRDPNAVNLVVFDSAIAAAEGGVDGLPEELGEEGDVPRE